MDKQEILSKIEDARELLSEVGEELEFNLSSENDWVNSEFEDIFESLNSIICALENED